METENTRPLISILLPTLNSVKFLKDRITSILSQSYVVWELIVADSYSTDGTWEQLTNLAASDSRVTIYQVPRGLYQAWNFCIQKAKGEYIYIATSDDFMEPCCLEKMLNALEENPTCGICDSVLQLIDEDGNEISECSPSFLPHYWHVDFPRDQKHIRKAPHDYYLHMGGKTVYTSITQLLIRKSVFNQTGLFETNMGSSADYGWGIQVALTTNIIFLPEKLASWRIHEDQATSTSNANSTDLNFMLMKQMAEQSLESIKKQNIHKNASKIFQLIPFKAMLLPAKRKKNSFNFLFCLQKTCFVHPFLLMEFLIYAMALYGKCNRNVWLIKAYDTMILHRIKKLGIKNDIIAITD